VASYHRHRPLLMKGPRVRCCIRTLCVVLALLGFCIVVDSFTTRGERLGYGTVNGNTGRVDTFTSSGQRTGNGTVTPGPTGGKR
jgi:hypothetical protein